MIASLRLVGHFVAISVRGQLQYRGSFLLMTAGQFFTCFVEAIGIWALFDRFGSLGIWTLSHIALLYGTVNICFAMVDIVARGFDNFGTALIRTGQFDRMLIRPVSLVLQVATREFPLFRIGRLIQGLLVLGYAFLTLDIEWSLFKVVLYLEALMATVILFYAIQIIRAGLSFWTIESLELVNTISHGGLEAAQYPMSIYREPLRDFFTFVVPLACAAYFPLVGVMGVDDPLGSTPFLQALAPFACLAFFGLCLWFWFIGVRSYRSTGS